MELHTVFCRLYDKLPERDTDGMKQVFFGALYLFLNLSVNLFLMDSPT
jgi:hypothetical protein